MLLLGSSKVLAGHRVVKYVVRTALRVHTLTESRFIEICIGLKCNGLAGDYLGTSKVVAWISLTGTISDIISRVTQFVGLTQ